MSIIPMPLIIGPHRAFTQPVTVIDFEELRTTYLARDSRSDTFMRQ
jgi:hypothetical protein